MARAYEPLDSQGFMASFYTVDPEFAFLHGKGEFRVFSFVIAELTSFNWCPLGVHIELRGITWYSE